MQTKKRRRSARKRTGARRARSSAGEKPVALTVKVDGETYVRLSTFRATQRRKTQDILEQALKEYLTRAGA
jgi:hypothetical protein